MRRTFQLHRSWRSVWTKLCQWSKRADPEERFLRQVLPAGDFRHVQALVIETERARLLIVYTN
jgi:hypothetical protein